MLIVGEVGGRGVEVGGAVQGGACVIVEVSS